MNSMLASMLFSGNLSVIIFAVCAAFAVMAWT
jgi:hypothetical protein